MLMRTRSVRRPRRPWDDAVARLDRLVHTALPGRHPRRDVRPGEPLRVLLPGGLTRLAAQSGIGAATRHQEEIVRALGHRVVRSPLRPFDVVHLNTPFPDTPLIARWARLWRRPVLVWAHSTEDDFRDSFTGSNLLAPLFRRWIAHVYRQGDVVLTPSAYSRSLITRPEYGLTRPVHALSNGVDTGFFQPDAGARDRLRAGLGLPADATVVISVGLQVVRKGILDWVEVARSMPGTTFVWYGRTDPRLLTAEVQRALADAPPNALFPGYVPAERLREAYAGADAFCFLTSEETEGIVLLEALACEVPVLVRGIPLYRDEFPDGEVTHQVAGGGAGFAERAAERLRALLDGELTDLRAAGRRAAEQRDLACVGRSLTGVYRGLGVLPHRRSGELSPVVPAATGPVLRPSGAGDAAHAAGR